MSGDAGLDRVETERDGSRAESEPLAHPAEEQKAEHDAEQHVHETRAVEKPISSVLLVEKAMADLERTLEGNRVRPGLVDGLRIE